MYEELFERVKFIAAKHAGGQVQLGESIGLNGRTFQNYLKKDRQDNLWPLLHKILVHYPQIDRNWLFFGEGEPLKSDNQVEEASNEQELYFQRECEILRARLADKEKIIALYEAREQEKHNSFTHPTDALGTQSAAPLSHHDSD